MDPQKFDTLSKALADGVSRRVLTRLGIGGLAAGLAAAVGRVGAAVPVAQAETCRLSLLANVRLGPSAGALLAGTAPGELGGELSFALGLDGAIDQGRLRLRGGTEFDVVGQAMGRAVNLRVQTGVGQSLVLVGTGEQGLDRCAGAVDGLLTGPQAGDLGDWHATATALDEPGDVDSTTATATTSPMFVGPTATASAVSTATVTTEPEPPTPEPCPTGETRCDDTCVDLQSDVANCGACGVVCVGDEICAGGVCGIEQCPVLGETRCGSICVDLQSDVANCGACDTTCGFGEVCSAGVCAFPPCPAGTTRCGEVPGLHAGACVNLMIDFINCGACGVVCQGAQQCVDGACVTAPDPCAPLTTCMTGQGGVCADLSNDPAHCGACNNACPSGQACNGAVCG